MLSFLRSDRWGLILTTQAGLETDGANVFDFGDHFVADIFVDLLNSEENHDLESRVVIHDADYYESPQKRAECDATAKPIDATRLLDALYQAARLLEQGLEAERAFDFSIEARQHLITLYGAMGFLESNAKRPLLLIAYCGPR